MAWLFEYGVATVLLAAASFTFKAGPDAVKLIHGSFYEFRIIGQDSGLEIAVPGAFHADAGAGEIGRTDVGQLAVEDQNLEVYARA